ncbi:hypothetical protein ACFFLM_25760 [Deinococcus oregonensis]|uniref:Uncharacterized protein n=1 Tax=Deinococcus oregonensis TaxID=1805970 RepID=A0ABV6B6F4_9DEIO
MNARINFLSVLPLLLLTGVVTWQSQQPFSNTVLKAVEPESGCTQPPSFRTGYQREGNGVSAIGTGFNFQGLAWIEASTCSPGTLSITAEGEIAANEAPELQVGLGSDLLLQQSFKEPQTVKLRVPRSGRLILGYFNDYYRSDARVATLESLEFLGLGCNTFKVQVPKATGGEWNVAARTASLVSSVPMTIFPCNAGVLSLQVMGQAGKNIFPQIAFRQDNKILNTIQTSGRRQDVTLRVDDHPVNIMLINPYFKQLADRNLNVRSVVFTPDAPNSP